MSQDVSGNQEFQDNPYQTTSPTPSFSEAIAFSTSDREIREALTSMSRWQSFFAVLGFVGTGLGFVALVPLLLIGALGGKAHATEFVGLVIIGVFAIAFYFIPSFLLWNAARNARLLANTGVGSVGQVLMSQCKFWRYVGWLTCLAIGVYCLIILVAFSLRG